MVLKSLLLGQNHLDLARPVLWRRLVAAKHPDVLRPRSGESSHSRFGAVLEQRAGRMSPATWEAAGPCPVDCVSAWGMVKRCEKWETKTSSVPSVSLNICDVRPSWLSLIGLKKVLTIAKFQRSQQISKNRTSSPTSAQKLSKRFQKISGIIQNHHKITPKLTQIISRSQIAHSNSSNIHPPIFHIYICRIMQV